MLATYAGRNVAQWNVIARKSPSWERYCKDTEDTGCLQWEPINRYLSGDSKQQTMPLQSSANWRCKRLHAHLVRSSKWSWSHDRLVDRPNNGTSSRDRLPRAITTTRLTQQVTVSTRVTKHWAATETVSLYNGWRRQRCIISAINQCHIGTN